MKYQEIRKESEKKRHQLMTDCNVFFAFNNEQFTEGSLKNPLQEGEKYTSIGAGGYLPKSKLNDFINGLDLISKCEKSEIKKYKEIDECIKFELYNHECFYSGDLTDVFNILPYDNKRILEVYNKERKNAIANY
jgi:hypothetical protein